MSLDPQMLSSVIEGATLVATTVSLPASEGHVESLQDLQDLPPKIHVNINISFNENLPIPLALRDLILEGLQALVNVADRLDGLPPFTLTLPLVDTSLAQALDLPGQLRDNLYNPVVNYFASDTTPTVRELLQVLRRTFTSIVSPSTAHELLFNFNFHGEKTATLPIDLGVDASGLGLSVDASAGLNLTTKFDFDFTVGIDLTPGLSPSDAFFIRVSKLEATGRIDATNLNFGIRAGFLGAGVQNGTAHLNATLSATFNNPDHDSAGRITLGELVGGDVVSLNAPTGSLNVVLPVAATVGGQNVAGTGPQPTIRITDANLFADPAPSFEAQNFEELLNFDLLTPQSVIGLLDQLGGWLDRFRDSEIFQTSVPFTTLTLGK